MLQVDNEQHEFLYRLLLLFVVSFIMTQSHRAHVCFHKEDDPWPKS